MKEKLFQQTQNITEILSYSKCFISANVNSNIKLSLIIEEEKESPKKETVVQVFFSDFFKTFECF